MKKSLLTLSIAVALIVPSCKKESFKQCPTIVRKEIVKVNEANNIFAYYIILSNQTKLQVSMYVFDAAIAGSEYCDSIKIAGGVPKDNRH